MFSRFVQRTFLCLVLGWLTWLPCSLRAANNPTAVITEFLAENTSGLVDEDGDHSDWIEISNPTLIPIQLDGWRLTDNPSDRSKWRFPQGVQVPAGGRVLVFASGKNRAVPGKPLHTNFSLRQEGEFLALYPPTGTLATSIFTPAFPPQRSDMSYGTGFRANPRPLIWETTPARISIPGGGDVDRRWTGSPAAEPFDETAWTISSTQVGYDDLSEESGRSLLGYWDFNDIQLPKVARDASGQGHSGTLIGGATYGVSGSGRTGKPGDYAVDLGPGGNVASVRIQSASAGSFDALQKLDQATLSLWCFGGPQQPMANCAFWIDSGATGDSRNFMAHLPWSDGIIYFDTAGCCGNDTRIYRQETDPNQWRARWNHYVFLKNKTRKEIWQNGVLWHSGEGAAPLNAIKSLWLGSGLDGSAPYPGKLDDIAIWAGALNASEIQSLAAGLSPTAIGSFRPRITTDLSQSMRGVSPLARMRIPFVVPDGPMPSTLSLSMRYDDGFAAWINGVELLKQNVPITRQRTKREVLTMETWTFEVPELLLHAGTNILAIEGVNDSASGSDFLLNAELRAGENLAGRFFTSPTPNAANDTGILGFTQTPEFSPGRGFYKAPQNVRIRSATPGAQIRYTLDGSTPSLTNGILVEPSAPNASPVLDLVLTNSQAIRVQALAPDFEPSSVETHTYLFAAGVENQPARISGYPNTWGIYGAYGPSPGKPVPADYEMDPDVVRTTAPGFSIRESIESLPALCLTTSVSNLFDAATGIYPNSATQGTQWERPASAELIFPDGTKGFQIDAGLRIHGGLSRQHWHARKHSFRLSFSRDYGPPRLHYRLFDDTRVTTFNELTLRASSTDSWSVEDAEPWTRPKATYMRDVWMKDTQESMGWPCGHSRYVHVFLNGVYWGQYNLAERTESVWLSENYGGAPEDYDIVKDGGEVDAGDRKIWDAMINLARAGLSSDAAYWAIQGRNPKGERDSKLPVYLDVDALIDYLILHIYAGGIDWPNHNWWSARQRGDSSPGFRFYTWDQEISNISLTWTTTYTGEAFESVSGPVDSPAFLYSKLRGNAAFRKRFAARVGELTSGFGILTPSQNSARWERRQSEINLGIIAESARWGDSRQAVPLKRSHWLTEMNWMKGTYWPNNHTIALDRFRRVALYPTSSTPTVSFSPNGGIVNAGSRVTLSGTGDIYYTLDGSDPIGANNKPVAVARKYTTPLPITGPTHLRARHSLGASWSQLGDASFLTPSNLAITTDLEVSEVHYHPETNELEEFIEIHNRAQTHPLLLGGGRIAGGVEFVFPNAWMVPPDGRAVVVRDRAAFEAKYGNSLPVAGTFIGSLANEGDWVHLLAASGKVTSRFRYNDSPPWPQLADGGGRSLTLRRATESVDPNDPLQWRASSVLGGTPGRDDGTPSPANPLDDADGDGWTALSEYFWGTSDTEAASVPRAAIPIQFTADGHALLQVSHPLGADQVEAFWETSTDLLIWGRIPDASMLGTVVEGDRETLQWALLKDVEDQRFFRFNLRLR